MRPGTFFSLLALAAVAPGAATAQIPDTAAADTIAPATRAAAPAYVPPRVAFSVSLGTLGFGDLHIQPVRVQRLGKDGTVLDDEGSLRRTMSAGEGLQVVASALLGLSPAWAVRVGASLGRATLAEAYSGEEQLREDVAALPDPVSPDLSSLAIEGALRFRMRSGRPFHPYAELGLAAVRIEPEDPTFPGAASLDGSVSLAGLAAVGAVVPVWDVFAGRLQLTGQFFRTAPAPAPTGERVTEGTRLRVTFEPPAVGSFADPMPELTRTLRFDVGILIDLGARSP